MTIQANDFGGNSLSGATVVANQKINISLPTVKTPLEGDKTFVVKIRQNSTVGDVLTESPTITLKDYSEIISIAVDAETIEEGGTVQFTITTANIDSYSNIYYTTSGNVTFNDFVGGNAGVITIIDNVGYANITANLDFNDFVEGEEQFSVQFRGDSIEGPIAGTSANIVLIRDSSNVVSLTGLSVSSNLIYESDSTVFTIDVINALGTNSQTLYYTVTGNADIYTGQSGSFLISGNQANLELIADTSVPSGEVRQFAVEIRRGSISGPVLQTSDTIYVQDYATYGITASGGDEILTVEI